MTERPKNPRRIIRWEKVRGPKAIAALTIATAWGAGLAPIAPGTMGSLVGVPLAYWSGEWDLLPRLTLWIALTVIGTWAARVFDELMQTGDNQNIVIDEVVGLGITAWTAGTNWKTLAVAFVLFRIFDIVKLPPVRQLDQWSKNAMKKGGPYAYWWSGFGVMADDIVAGFQGLLVIIILQSLGILP